MILSSVSPLGAERVDLLAALGRVVSEDVVAPWDLPFCDNSAMDGYAVRADDCRGPARLKITGYIPAGGTASVAVEPGCAVKIMTGAPTPAGCDAVIPIEETEEADGHVVVKGRVTIRQHIRFRGQDVRSGDAVVAAGTVVYPPEISMLASFGKATVPVYRRARVAVLSTGDELIELGGQPVNGKIINSNAFSLAAAIRETGAEAVLLGIARDNMESHRERMTEGLKADALVTSAGVSAGDLDLVRDCLAELGVRQLFWKVDIKPGGPTAFGMKDGDAGLLPPREPGVHDDHVRGACTAGAPPDDGATESDQAVRASDVARRCAQEGGQVAFPEGQDRGGERQELGDQRRRPEYGHPGDHAQGQRYRAPPEGSDRFFRGGRSGSAPTSQ